MARDEAVGDAGDELSSARHTPFILLKVMRLGIVGVVALTALVTFGSRAQAQQERGDEGSATAAIAVGSAELTCGLCGGDRSRAPSGYVRVGRAIAPGLVLSGELDMWSKSEEWVLTSDTGVESRGTSRFTIATLEAVAQWYPLRSHGVFVDAGLGAGRYSARSKSRDVGGTSVYSNAVGYLAGLGYDIPVSSRLAITPSVKMFGFAGAKIKDVEGRVGANVAQIALGLTWH